MIAHNARRNCSILPAADWLQKSILLRELLGIVYSIGVPHLVIIQQLWFVLLVLLIKILPSELPGYVGDSSSQVILLPTRQLEEKPTRETGQFFNCFAFLKRYLFRYKSTRHRDNIFTYHKDITSFTSLVKKTNMELNITTLQT